MPNNYAIGSLGYPSLGATDYQALAAIMNTPNPNSQVAFRGNTQTTQTTAQPQVQYVQQPEKKNSKAPIVLGVIGALGAGACIYAACKGEGTGLARVKDGFGKILDGIKGKAVEATAQATKSATTAAEEATAGKCTIRTIGTGTNAKTIVTMPGEENIIVGNQLEQGLKDIGIDKSALTGSGVLNRFNTTGNLKEGNKLRSIVVESKLAGANDAGTYTIFGSSEGNIGILLDGKKVVPDTRMAKDGEICIASENYDSLVERVKNIFSGNTKLKDVYEGSADNLTLLQAGIEETKKDLGVVSHIRIGGIKKVGGKWVASTPTTSETLRQVTTNMFGLDHNTVWAQRKVNPQLNKFLEDYKAAKSGDLMSKLGANLATATYTPPKTQKINGHVCTFTLDGSRNVLSYSYEEGGKTIVVDANKNKKVFDGVSEKYKEIFESFKKPDFDTSKLKNLVFAV